MREQMVCATTNTVACETTSTSVIAVRSRTSRRASAAVLIMLTLIISAVMCAPGAGATFKAYADEASSAIGIVKVDGKD